MKTKKSIALLLCLLLTLTLFVPSSTAFAVDRDSGTDNGMKVSKTATANGDGTYTIELEAYATGNKVISEVKKDIPTDIVLVLDQSGSMSRDIGTVSFEAYKDETGRWGTTYHTRNQDYYEYRHNGGSGNLWHKVGEAYYSVSVVRQTFPKYSPLDKDTTTNITYYNAGSLYEKIGEDYKTVTVSREWGQYIYSFNDGTPISSSGWNTVPDLGSHAPLYTAVVDDSQNIYKYSYTNEDGEVVEIGSSTGATTVFNPVLYQRVVNSNGGGSRLDALKKAVTTFANSVATKAKGADGQLGTDDDINHRIAVVGFASESGDGNNTELLSIKGSNSGSVGVSYNRITDQNYKDVLQDMNTTSGQQMVNNAIDALAANGATETDLGLVMAKNILDKNPVEDGEKRNRVVIVFTDGSPTSSNGFEKEVAQTAISKAAEIKNEKTSVYSVGIFSGADATSPGTEPNGDLNSTSGSLPAASNWFMQNLSSNNGTPQTPSYYLSAADASTLNNIFKQISDQIESGGSSTTLDSNTVVKDIIAPHFTLPAGADANDITLETYECTGKNGDDYTWSKNATAMGAHAEINDITDENGVVSKTVSVTGFDFAGNYVGPITENGTVTGYKGHKLVISFKVVPKDGFLGGNNVYTNTSAGIYENGSAATPVKEFNRPQVNVPIKPITVTAQDQNVYLLADVTVDALKEATTVKVGDVELDLTKDNYGLEPWQNAYVNILPKVTYGNPDIEATDLTDLTDDVAYTVAVTVSPKEDATSTIGTAATSQSGHGTANVNVFKPVLTFQDSAEDYLSPHEFPGYYGENNYVSTLTAWKHTKVLEDLTTEVKDASTVDMVGTAPSLALVYTADAADITGLTNGAGQGTIAADHDIPVNVAVSIGETNVTNHVTFNHQCYRQDLESTCGWSYGDSHTGNATVSETDSTSVPEFLIHVKNIVADLKITKTGLNTNVYPDGDNESAIVTVKCENPAIDGREWTIALTKEGHWTATLAGLKVGATYIVTEQTGWTWRYTSTNPTNTVTIVKEGSSVTIENTQTNPYWLGGDNYCVNEFGIVGQDASGN